MALNFGQLTQFTKKLKETIVEKLTETVNSLEQEREKFIEQKKVENVVLVEPGISDARVAVWNDSMRQ
jgi:hypothetical protein